jgi:hypothetical protein
MAQLLPQNFKNHARYVPLYHFVLFFMLVALLARATWAMIGHFSADTVSQFLLVAAVVLAAFFARSFALTAQDRVIRLEMKLRMQAVTPQLMPRFAEFTTGQLVALRYAGDVELQGLAQQVLDGKLTRGADIKKQVRDWQADRLRV